MKMTETISSGKVILLYETMDDSSDKAVEEEEKVQIRACAVEGTQKVVYLCVASILVCVCR
jgi:hypothetical protein